MSLSSLSSVASADSLLLARFLAERARGPSSVVSFLSALAQASALLSLASPLASLDPPTPL
eukprot:13868076-Alexandrium_andersonii.AAC.1